MLMKIKNYFTKKKEKKLGLVMGVLIPTLLNMFGVVLFLRVGVISNFTILNFKNSWTSRIMADHFYFCFGIHHCYTHNVITVCYLYFYSHKIKVQMEK
jgi:hypothetical protein